MSIQHTGSYRHQFYCSHLLERGESFREQSSRRSTANLNEDLSQNISDNSPEPSEVQAEGARDFEKRLQYAMKQSLILQEKQLKDIEVLQEELGQEATGVSNRIVVPNKRDVMEKIRKPLKGILKKSVMRYCAIFADCLLYIGPPAVKFWYSNSVLSFAWGAADLYIATLVCSCLQLRCKHFFIFRYCLKHDEIFFIEQLSEYFHAPCNHQMRAILTRKPSYYFSPIIFLV